MKELFEERNNLMFVNLANNGLGSQILRDLKIKAV